MRKCLAMSGAVSCERRCPSRSTSRKKYLASRQLNPFADANSNPEILRDAVTSGIAQSSEDIPFSWDQPNINSIEKAFAKFTALTRKAQEWMIEAFWTAIGELIDSSLRKSRIETTRAGSGPCLDDDGSPRGRPQSVERRRAGWISDARFGLRQRFCARGRRRDPRGCGLTLVDCRRTYKRRYLIDPPFRTDVAAVIFPSPNRSCRAAGFGSAGFASGA
jgi:hypothetical protein